MSAKYVECHFCIITVFPLNISISYIMTVVPTSVLNTYIDYIIKGDKECHLII